jgi:hypothetical protein
MSLAIRRLWYRSLWTLLTELYSLSVTFCTITHLTPYLSLSFEIYVRTSGNLGILTTAQKNNLDKENIFLLFLLLL